MPNMLHLMQDMWALPTPNLLISVTGGAKDFTMMPGLKEVFRRGLMKAAESTGIIALLKDQGDLLECSYLYH